MADHASEGQIGLIAGDAGARALFHEAHILAEPPSLSEGSGPPSAGMAPRYVQDKSLKESVAELETLFLDSGLDTNWHPPASAAGSTARLVRFKFPDFLIKLSFRRHMRRALITRDPQDAVLGSCVGSV